MKQKYISKILIIALFFTMIITLASCSNTQATIDSLSNDLTQLIEKGDIESAGKKLDELKELVESNVLEDYRKQLEDKGFEQITSLLVSGDDDTAKSTIESLKKFVKEPTKLEERYTKLKTDIDHLKKLEQEKDITVLINELDSITSNEAIINNQKNELKKKLETTLSKDLIDKYHKAIEEADIKEAATICAVLSNLEHKTKETNDVLSNFSTITTGIDSIMKEHSNVVHNLQEVIRPPSWDWDNLIKDSEYNEEFARWMSLPDYYDLLGPNITTEYKDAIIENHLHGTVENDYIYMFPGGVGGPIHKKAICEEAHYIKIIDSTTIDVTNRTVYYDPEGAPLYDKHSDLKETINGIEHSALEEFETLHYQLIDGKWMCTDSSVNGLQKMFTADYEYTTSENLEKLKKTLDIANDKGFDYKKYYSKERQADNQSDKVKGTYKVTVDSLRARSGPSTNDEVLGYLTEGKTYQYYEENGNWIKIEYNNNYAWTHSGYGIKNSKTENDTNILAEIPEKFVFSSGVGGWSTYILISPDGTFTGEYTGQESGKALLCTFEGAFKDIKKINDYEYSMKIDYLKTTGTEGEVQKDGYILKTITSTPYGFEDADDFILYLPGRRTEDLDEKFLNWLASPHSWGKIPAKLPVYGLYNVKGGTGFSGGSQ